MVVLTLLPVHFLSDKDFREKTAAIEAISDYTCSWKNTDKCTLRYYIGHKRYCPCRCSEREEAFGAPRDRDLLGAFSIFPPCRLPKGLGTVRLGWSIVDGIKMSCTHTQLSLTWVQLYPFRSIISVLAMVCSLSTTERLHFMKIILKETALKSTD